MNPEDDRFSAWLDDELGPAERLAVEQELAANPKRAAEVEDLASVRSLLRNAALIEPRDGALDRIVSSVAADPGLAPVISLASRRRVPLIAAMAASFAIIASVVGGLGGSSTLPAVGRLIAQHEAAASVSHHDPITATDMPTLGDTMALMHTEADHGVVHALYATDEGDMVSVFRQDGHLDAEALSDDMHGMGSTSDMGGHAMWSADVDGSHVAVLDGDGYVWTVVTSTNTEMSMDVMADLPGRSESVADRLAAVAESIVEPFELFGS